MQVLVFNVAMDQDDSRRGFAGRWVELLARRASYVHVITMHAGRVQAPQNVEVRSVGKERRYSRLRRAVEFYRHLFSALHAHDFDACFVHMNPPFAVLAAPVLRWRKIPIVTWYSHPAASLLARLVFVLSDRVMTAAPEVRARLGSKAILTNHGIDLPAFSAAPRASEARSRRPALVTVGRISPVKDCETLIRAARLLVDDHHLSGLQVTFFGEVPDRDRRYADALRLLVRNLGLERHVEFAGPVRHGEVPAVLGRSDVFVNMQATGGKGKAVLEALAAGVPALVCTPAFDDDFGPWKSVLSFAPGDPADLAAKAVQVLAMPESERGRLRRHLRDVAQRHSLDHLMDLVVATLRGAAGARARTVAGAS